VGVLDRVSSPIGPAVLAGFGVFTSLVMEKHGAPWILQQWWAWAAVGLVLAAGPAVAVTERAARARRSMKGGAQSRQPVELVPSTC
jgi:hypothetical protein